MSLPVSVTPKYPNWDGTSYDRSFEETQQLTSNSAFDDNQLRAEVLAHQEALANFQSIDSDLEAIAALTTTEFGRSFLTLVDAPSARTTLSVPTGSGSSTGTNTGDQVITLTGEGTGSGTSSFGLTLSNDAVITKVLTNYISGTGTIAATDTILQAVQKLNGNAGLRLFISNNLSDLDDVVIARANLGVPAGSGSSTGTNTGDQTSVSGNAGTATALATARTINGVSFNGSADITVAAAAGTLSGATLNASVTASSLTSVGTLIGGATGAGFTMALSSSTVTGTLADARLSGNIPLLNALNTWTTGPQTIISESTGIKRALILSRSGDALSVATEFYMGGGLMSLGANGTAKIFFDVSNGRLGIGATATPYVFLVAGGGSSGAARFEQGSTTAPAIQTRVPAAQTELVWLSKGLTSTSADGVMCGIGSFWTVSTHATRTGLMTGSAHYIDAAQEGWRVEANIAGVRLGFYGQAAVARPSSTGQTSGLSAGVGTPILSDSTFTGGTGSTAYTTGDIVKHLKAMGLLTT